MMGISVLMEYYLIYVRVDLCVLRIFFGLSGWNLPSLGCFHSTDLDMCVCTLVIQGLEKEN